MKDKKTFDYIILTYVLTSILWCAVFALIIGKINKSYKDEIGTLKQKIELLETKKN